MSILDKIVDHLGLEMPIETVIDFGQHSNPVIEDSSQLFSADFSRDGADLILSNFGQPDIRLPGYFHADNPADIHTKDGKVLSGDVVEKLAGPEFPAQYAQAGSTGDAGAIGQVESISGDVTVLRASGVRETLSLGAKVFANDVVQTGDGGALSLTFIDGTIFTLAESSRMVLDSLIYDPASSANSGIFNLVEGSFVFIAGEVAKTGGMDVKTPAATMGIRGTTVIVKITSTNGVSEVEVSLNQDPDGGQGQFTITGLDGSVIAEIDNIATKWVISPVEGQTREIERTPDELGADQNFLGQAIGAYRSANERVNDGGEFVETEGGGTETPQNPDGDPNAPQDQPNEPTDETPEGEPAEDDRRGTLGSGIKTELATDTSQPESITESVVISELKRSGEVFVVDEFETDDDPVFTPIEELVETDEIVHLEREVPDEVEPFVMPVNSPPIITPPEVTTEVLEDGSVVLNNFDFSDINGDILTATITAGSTLTLAEGSGVTILQGTGVDEVVTEIRGTGEQISNALNGAIYKPTSDADVSGTLTVVLSDGEFSTAEVITIDIVPIQDAPVALPDTLEAGQDDSSLTGNLLANDYDVDTSPFPDELTVVRVSADDEDFELTEGSVTIFLTSGAVITVSQDGSYSFDTHGAFDGLSEGESATETISYTLSDGHEAEHGETTTGQLSVTITGVNDAPVLTASDGVTVQYTENGSIVVNPTVVTIEDSDAGDLISAATVTISNNFEVGDILGFFDTESITGSYDAATGILTLTGNDTAANYETALGSISYLSTSQNPSELPRTISYQVADEDGRLSNVAVGGGVNPKAVNDAPSIAPLDEFDFTEDQPGSITFSSAILSDPDVASGEISLTISVDSGTLTFPSATGITISGNTLTGTIADINQYLIHGGTDGNTITFEPELNNTDPVALTLAVNDQGNTGGSPLTDTASTTINIDPVNDAPVLTEFPLEFEVDEDITQDINFYDLEPLGETFSDSDAGDNVVEFIFTLSSGVLTFPPGGAGITISGNKITGTVAAINDYLNNGGTDDTFVRFTTDLNSTEDVSLNITVNDLGNTGSGGAMSDSVDLDIIVHPVDDPAEVTLSVDTNSYTEGHAPVVIDSAVSVEDVDSTTLTRAGIVISENFEAESDILSFTDTATITGLYDPTTGVLVLTGTDTIAAYEAALSSVTYHNTSDNPDTQDRTILFNVDDGAGFGVSDTVTVSVISSNDAPDIHPESIAASAEEVINGGFQDGIYNVGGVNVLASGSTNVASWTVTDDNVEYLQEISAGDDGERNRIVNLNGDEPGAINTMIDATVGQQYELSFQGFGDGTLDVMATGGTTESYTFVSDENGKYHSYTFTATAVMTTLTFTSTTSGAFGPTLDDVTVREVVGDTFDVVEDTPIEISDIQITDVDADPGATYSATLSSSFGLLTIKENVQGGLDFDQISGNGTYTVTLTGSLFQINETLAAVDGVTYTPNLDFNGADTIEVHVSDGHATDPQTGTETISLNVQPVDDAPAASSDVGDVVEGNVANLSGIQFVGFDDATVSHSVSNVGDINDDGIDDFAIGATDSSADDVGSPNLTGSVYVIYGIEGKNPYAAYANADGEIDLNSMAADGAAFELVGVASGDRTGFSVSGGGDINNDGISDIVVGAHFVDSPLNSGTAYVIYGGQEFDSLSTGENGEIPLADLGLSGSGHLAGFKFNHTVSNAELGYDVSLTGDLNNDGISDLIVSSLSGATLADSGSWVVFGGQDFAAATDSTTGAFTTSDVGSSVDGFVLNGETAADDAGVSIDVVSDFDGDGIDDLLIGASGESGVATQAGASYLIYGGQDWDALKLVSSSPAISLTQLGSGSTDLQGFKIQNDAEGGSLGLSVSSAGDVNGDGIGDLLVTAPGNSSTYTTSSTYLIYGGQNLSGTIATSLIGSVGTGAVNGAVFTERLESEYISQATALGDIDGDGYSDILIGSQSVSDGTGGSVGHSYIIYGSSAPASGTHSLATVGSSIDGFTITGEDSSTLYGNQAQSVGDVNSDGYNDFLVTDFSNDDGGPGAGAAYLIYGSDFNNRLDLVAGADELVGGPGRSIIHGTPGDDVINGGGGGDIITTGAGDDEITIGNSAIDFIDAGAGTDTLKFGDSGSFDLTNIKDLRLQSIEALDTANGLFNNVTLDITDIFQITDDANTEVESLLSAVLPTSFLIDADSNDTYQLTNNSYAGAWEKNDALSSSTPDYDVYEYVEGGSADVLATLAIDDDASVSLSFPA